MNNEEINNKIANLLTIKTEDSISSSEFFKNSSLYQIANYVAGAKFYQLNIDEKRLAEAERLLETYQGWYLISERIEELKAEENSKDELVGAEFYQLRMSLHSRPQLEESAREFLESNNYASTYSVWTKRLVDFAIQEIAEFCGFSFSGTETNLNQLSKESEQNVEQDELKAIKENFVEGLTEKQQRFIELERQKAGHKQFFDDLRNATKELLQEQGFDTYFQDDEGVVYKITPVEGRFTYDQIFDVKRTRREGEVKGSLSMKEAQEAGFQFPVKS